MARLMVGCFDGDPAKQFNGYLYLSEDAGIDWTTRRLPETVQASLDTLIFFDADHALLLGREMYRTSDAGRTWSHVKSVEWDGQFSFVDAQHGWAIARAGQEIALVQTTNGGSTWIEITPTVTR